jgi:hypothetical protein
MRYAIKNPDGEVLAIYDLNNIGEAVEIKLSLQRDHNESWGVDEIYSVARATPSEVRAFGTKFKCSA